VIEAIAERMDWKLDLYTKIAPHLAPHAIVASNTSGLSITKLVRCCPKKSNRASAAFIFSTHLATCCLVELINTPTTQAANFG
jgi:3-hydroxyacyl-CoA dehydrogenase